MARLAEAVMQLELGLREAVLLLDCQLRLARHLMLPRNQIPAESLFRSLSAIQFQSQKSEMGNQI